MASKPHSEREPVITLRSAAEHLSSRLTLEPNPVELENAADLLLHFAKRMDDLEEQLEAAREALGEYAKATNWAIGRDFRDGPECIWIGEGALENPPNAVGIARRALASSPASRPEEK